LGSEGGTSGAWRILQFFLKKEGILSIWFTLLFEIIILNTAKYVGVPLKSA